MALIVIAYVDPSTGGLLFQVLALAFASISGVLFLFSRQIRAAAARARRFIGSRTSRR
jgi:hypothetical protein